MEIRVDVCGVAGICSLESTGDLHGGRRSCTPASRDVDLATADIPLRRCARIVDC